MMPAASLSLSTVSTSVRMKTEAATKVSRICRHARPCRKLHQLCRYGFTPMKVTTASPAQLAPKKSCILVRGKKTTATDERRSLRNRSTASK